MLLEKNKNKKQDIKNIHFQWPPSPLQLECLVEFVEASLVTPTFLHLKSPFSLRSVLCYRYKH